MDLHPGYTVVVIGKYADKPASPVDAQVAGCWGMNLKTKVGPYKAQQVMFEPVPIKGQYRMYMGDKHVADFEALFGAWDDYRFAIEQLVTQKIIGSVYSFTASATNTGWVVEVVCRLRIKQLNPDGAWQLGPNEKYTFKQNIEQVQPVWNQKGYPVNPEVQKIVNAPPPFDALFGQGFGAYGEKKPQNQFVITSASQSIDGNYKYVGKNDWNETVEFTSNFEIPVGSKIKVDQHQGVTEIEPYEVVTSKSEIDFTPPAPPPKTPAQQWHGSLELPESLALIIETGSDNLVWRIATHMQDLGPTAAVRLRLKGMTTGKRLMFIGTAKGLDEWMLTDLIARHD